MVCIWWIREDLRVADNPALGWAALQGDVLPVFVLPEGDGSRPLGAASRWWLHHSLRELGTRVPLVLKRGDAREILPALVADCDAKAVAFNRCYGPAEQRLERELAELLRHAGIAVRAFNGNLLHDPAALTTGTGGSYAVFTPFWKKLVAGGLGVSGIGMMPGVANPKQVRWAQKVAGDDLAGWQLLPQSPDWAAGWGRLWAPGEVGALARWEDFMDTALDGYAELRDRVDLAQTSRLSAHLRWGEIAPARLVRDLGKQALQNPDAAKFLSELGWREFARHQLYHFPALATRNWKPRFDRYPWRDITQPEVARDLRLWQQGRTGYPLVDAGMRELWATGFLHNRARMVAASFLVKHLRIDWRQGEAWFWDTLLDADPANNPAGWQWVAGCGADAAPYFRIFNPEAQAVKFDPKGTYVARWAGKEGYGQPMVDHAKARKAALEGFARTT